MEPQAPRIADLAAIDPVAAYGILLGIPRIPISMNCKVSFSSLAVPQPPLEGDLDTTIVQRTWIEKIDYSIRAPNVLQGNALATLWLWGLRHEPGIDVRVTVHSGPRYLVSPQFTPINNFVGLINDSWPHGWPLFKHQSIAVEFSLRAAPGGITDPDAAPLDVILTFTGWQFLDHTLDNLTGGEAAAKLKQMGFCVPDPACIRRSPPGG